MIYPVQTFAERSSAEEPQGYVTFRVAGQWLGIPVVQVQEVLAEQIVSPVPLAPQEVAGFLNLRGQIVTAVDLRTRFGLPARSPGDGFMNVVVRDQNELFSLLVDEVGDVVEVRNDELEATPRTLDDVWRTCCSAVVQHPDGLLAVVDVAAALQIERWNGHNA